jgi:aminoglycoside phosphotransferase (APT) family kinase protein
VLRVTVAGPIIQIVGPHENLPPNYKMTPSKIFKELTQTEISQVVNDLCGNHTKILDCVLLKGGVFNTSYLVKTNRDRNGMVLRVAPVNRHLLYDFEKSMMSAEPLFYQLLQAKGIPTSEVMHYDNTYEVIDREYIIFKYIRSVPMNDRRVPEKARPSLYQRLGAIIRRLHDIQDEKFGWKRPTGELRMYDTWGAFLQRFAQEIADRSAAYALFRADVLTRFIDVFSHRGFDQIKPARMVHADLWEGNVLVCEEAGDWRIAALIDVDKALFGDPDLEFAYPTVLNDDFLQGYGPRASHSPETMLRRNAYRVLVSFMYTYIWYAQFDDQVKYAQAKQAGITALEQFESKF